MRYHNCNIDHKNFTHLAINSIIICKSILLSYISNVMCFINELNRYCNSEYSFSIKWFNVYILVFY